MYISRALSCLEYQRHSRFHFLKSDAKSLTLLLLRRNGQRWADCTVCTETRHSMDSPLPTLHTCSWQEPWIPGLGTGLACSCYSKKTNKWTNRLCSVTEQQKLQWRWGHLCHWWLSHFSSTSRSHHISAGQDGAPWQPPLGTASSSASAQLLWWIGDFPVSGMSKEHWSEQWNESYIQCV